MKTQSRKNNNKKITKSRLLIIFPNQIYNIVKWKKHNTHTKNGSKVFMSMRTAIRAPGRDPAIVGVP